MREFLGFLTLLAWVAIISIAAIGIERFFDRRGYRRTFPDQPGERHVPPLPPE